jgi:hypothetical protein
MLTEALAGATRLRRIKATTEDEVVGNGLLNR